MHIILHYRLLGINFMSSMRRARIRAFKILDIKSDSASIEEEDKDGPTEVVQF